ncbi:MOSC domain-containing protein [Rhizobium pusense]|uniref:MOSC domain-containing protein n=1 Tax=Agrobacterium pusense TaxID=648995 RepID=A0A6H0ZTN4_9HYPH|nr:MULTISPECIES: MOSC N-terminal beta barrel domain-containing protein [Agrobacterium]MDH2088959.1 MOSC domain-containing protein [Agrobacterium pusense]QIX24205.1 MOSC domain-containing protein [Agrobacterium pusense]RAL99412.1 MOSC domain-containing protein [Agrobacterium sp. MS2]WCK26351.1 MOSC domain-containing protein [Agrobacterium pusense]
MTVTFRSKHVIGKVAEIWRFPVSSLGGERCKCAEIEPAGIVGDRRFALFDNVSGVAAAPEKDVRWRPALFLRSAIDDGGVRITFPNGCNFYIEDSQLRLELSKYFGFDVGIGSYIDADPLAPSLPTVENRYSRSALHLVTTSSLAELQQMSSDSTVDRLRFRPNILLETSNVTGFAEFQWIGKVISFGLAEVEVTDLTKRCGMILAAQPDLPEQPEILRTVLRKAGRAFGVYCEPVKIGNIESGQRAELISG